MRLALLASFLVFSFSSIVSADVPIAFIPRTQALGRRKDVQRERHRQCVCFITQFKVSSRRLGWKVRCDGVCHGNTRRAMYAR